MDRDKITNLEGLVLGRLFQIRKNLILTRGGHQKAEKFHRQTSKKLDNAVIWMNSIGGMAAAGSLMGSARAPPYISVGTIHIVVIDQFN
jgi:hypothetical protein